jgi:amidase
MTRVHAFTDDALGHHDAVALTEEIASGRVSIPEVVEAAIARTESVNGELNAVAHADWDGARERAADPRGGFFAGVPTFVKDNVDVAGMPTMQGTDAWEPAPRPADGDFARMYLATGLVPLGKTQLSEFGFSASAEHPRLGPVRSPWSLERTAGAPRAPPPWSPRAPSRSPTPTTAAARSGSPPRSTGWSASSPPAAGSPRTC